MTRRTCKLVWAALLVVPLAFMSVASVVSRGGAAPGLTAPLFWLAVVASALNIVLSRVLPRRLGPARSADPEAVAFGRLLVAFALCDAAAIAPLVAYILTRDPRLLGVLAVDLLALVVLFPSDHRWQTVMPEGGDGPSPRREH